MLSVCLCVCLSICSVSSVSLPATRVHCDKMTEVRTRRLSHKSSVILSFYHGRFDNVIIQGGPLDREAQTRVGWLSIRVNDANCQVKRKLISNTYPQCI